MTQHQKIISRLKQGWCTGLQALQDCGTLKLSSRITELRREGYEIEDMWMESEGKRFKAYRIIGDTNGRS